VQVLEHERVDTGWIKLYIGHPLAQTDREIGVLVHAFPAPGEEALIFHVDNLAVKFKRFREEPP
jgi:hypothetical protein